MNDSVAKPVMPETSRQRRWLGLRSISRFASSLTMSALLIWICMSTLRNWQRLVAGPGSPNLARETKSIELDTAQFRPPISGPISMRSGAWGVEGWDGSVIVEHLATRDLESALTRILTSSKANTALPQPEFTAWLQTAKSIFSTPRWIDQKLIYGFDEEHARIRIATEVVQNVEHFSAGAFASRVSANRWIVFAIQDLPREQTASLQTPMLPLDSESVIKMTRMDTRGRPLFQLIRTPRFPRSQLKKWADEGWIVEVKVEHPHSAFSVVCHKDGVGVNLWTTGISDRPGLAILTRLTMPTN